MFKNLIKSSVLAVAAMALITSAAFADDTTVVVTGGSLSILSDPTATDFDGADIGDASTTADLDAFSVADLRGTGAGWHVTAGASQFTRTPSGHNLATSSLSMSEPGVTANGTTSPDPDVNTGPYILDSGTAAVVASAALGEGMGGAYDFDATTLTLALPADVWAGSYASTVTISVVTAP